MNDGLVRGTMAKLVADFEESSLPYTIDIIDYPLLKHKEFVDHIERVGVAFYRR